MLHQKINSGDIKNLVLNNMIQIVLLPIFFVAFPIHEVYCHLSPCLTEVTSQKAIITDP